MDKGISIVMPVYNAEMSLENTICSIINQTHAHWELICIDDESLDDSYKILLRFTKEDARIKVIQQKNYGPSVARNAGLQLVKFQYLTFVDADDLLSKNYLELLFNKISENSKLDLVCGGYYELNRQFPKGIPLHDFQSYLPQEVISRKQFLDNLFLGLTGVLWGKLFKKSIFDEHNLQLNPDLKLSEDLLLVLQYVKKIKYIGIIPENIYSYNRLQESGLSGRLDETYIQNIKVFNALILKEHNNDFNIDVILQNRTFYLLLKMLKDQSNQTAVLKETYFEIKKEFSLKNKNIRIFDRLFLFLIKNNLYCLASSQQKLYLLLRNIKNA